MSDVIIIGGGVIGLSLADEFAGRGLAVILLEQGSLAREASWAGAGMLLPGHPERARTSIGRLRALSHVLWPDLSRRLREETGIDNGFRRCGGIEVRLNGPAHELDREIIDWSDEGVEVQRLRPDEVGRYEPGLTSSVTAAYRLPDLGQVRNPWHLKALTASCHARGVSLVEGAPVIGFDIAHERVVAVRTPDDRFTASVFCVAGGAWSRQLLSTINVEIGVKPVRGQIVLLAAQPAELVHVIQTGRRYLVPRADGRVLVGSTEEEAGFDKRTTAGGVSELTRLAVELVPSLAGARFERAWSGLRPGSIDELPYLGRVPAIENLFVAAGHFRSGLQMSPATAVVMRQLMLDAPTTVPLDAFRCDRHPAPANDKAPLAATEASRRSG